MILGVVGYKYPAGPTPNRIGLINKMIEATIIAAIAVVIALVTSKWLADQRRMNRQLARDLATSDQRYKDIVDLAGEYVTEIDSAGRFVKMSERVHKLLGYQVSEVIGKYPWDFVPPDDRQAYNEMLMNYVSKGQSFTNIEHRKLTKDGRIVWLSVSGCPLFDGTGKVTGYLAIGEDITERREFVEHLKEAKLSAEAADRAKSDFLAVMSHEIRTPMNGIIGFANLLSNSSLDQQQREYVETIQESGDALLILINDILDFSKIESGAMVLESEPLNLRNCIYGVLNLTAHNASKKDIELLGEIDEDVPDWIIGDIARLRQILINLVGNAIKFTSSGSVKVAVQVADIEDREGNLEYQLVFSVTDTGIGIAPDRINKLFKPFSQADSSTTRKYGGTGLGLAICKRLVTQMGGEIFVNSQLGAGSRFSFQIPVMETTEGTTNPTVGSVFDIQKFALVVGKQDADLDHVIAHLRNWGVNTTLAGSHEEALAAIESNSHWDCVIIINDIADINAHELVSSTRNLHSDLDFILIDNDAHAQLVKADNSNFLTGIDRPIATEQLFEAVAQVLSQSKRSRKKHTAQPSTEPAAVSSELRVLLAEDNKVNLRVANLMLHKLGYYTETVENGKQAVERVAAGGIDLILMDLQMPEMDGIEATREIRRREQQSNASPIEIIAITADAMQGDRERTLAAGMDDYLTKPIKPKPLQDALERAAARLAEKKSTTEA